MHHSPIHPPTITFSYLSSIHPFIYPLSSIHSFIYPSCITHSSSTHPSSYLFPGLIHPSNSIYPSSVLSCIHLLIHPPFINLPIYSFIHTPIQPTIHPYSIHPFTLHSSTHPVLSVHHLSTHAPTHLFNIHPPILHHSTSLTSLLLNASLPSHTPFLSTFSPINYLPPTRSPLCAFE